MNDKIMRVWLRIALTAAALLPCMARSASGADWKPTAEVQRELMVLDSLVADYGGDENLAAERQAAQLRQRASKAKDDEERYLIYSMLYNEYKTFMADSAQKYVRLMADIAERTGNARWRAESRIRNSFVLAASGLLKEGLEAVDSMEGSQLDPDLRKEYYGQMIYLYSHLGNFSVKSNLSSGYYHKEQLYKDSITEMLTPEDGDYLWYMGWKYLDTGDTPKIRALAEKLRGKLAGTALDTRADAMDAYMMSRLLDNLGKNDEALTWMARSAIADIRSRNRDIASLEELARIMYERGDVSRAHSYLRTAISAALLYPNRVRMAGNIPALDEISKAYGSQLQKEKRRSRIYSIVITVVTLLLLIVIAGMVKSRCDLRVKSRKLSESNSRLESNMRDLSSMKSQLEEANGRLEELNSRLSQSNSELSESNYMKEEYLGYVFSLSSSYIRDNEDFRKSIRTKLKAGQYDEVARMVGAPGLSKEQMKEFYHNFDTIFLNMYPTFIDDFNALLMPEEQIHPKEGELLNTELRIYALVRLGITDSVKIAEFLHCSPQTVYNNRFRVRNKSHIAREDFVAAVKGLGRFNP